MPLVKNSTSSGYKVKSCNTNYANAKLASKRNYGLLKIELAETGQSLRRSC